MNYATKGKPVTSVNHCNRIEVKHIKILFQKKIGTFKGCDVWLQHIEDNTPPNYASYCVQYGGGGHYFPTLKEAEVYLKKRKFTKGKIDYETDPN